MITGHRWQAPRVRGRAPPSRKSQKHPSPHPGTRPGLWAAGPDASQMLSSDRSHSPGQPSCHQGNTRLQPYRSWTQGQQGPLLRTSPLGNTWDPRLASVSDAYLPSSWPLAGDKPSRFRPGTHVSSDTLPGLRSPGGLLLPAQSGLWQQLAVSMFGGHQVIKDSASTPLTQPEAQGERGGRPLPIARRPTAWTRPSPPAQ